MRGDITPGRAVVQSAGHAFRLETDLLKIELEARACKCCQVIKTEFHHFLCYVMNRDV